MNREYKKCIVAFVDILGFSDAVRKTAEDPKGIQDIYSILDKYSKENELKEKYIGFRNGDGSDLDAHDLTELAEIYPIIVTQFSDSFVFSAEVDNFHACGYVMFVLVTLMNDVFQAGYLLRGGVTVGDLIHEPDGPLFGPGFLEAYAIESKQASYGRIVVSKKCMDFHVRVGSNDVPILGQGVSFVTLANDGLYEVTLGSFLYEKLKNNPDNCKREIEQAIKRLDERILGLKDSERLAIEPKMKYVIHKLNEKLSELAENAN